jgi:hypothetical protein
MLPCAKIKWFYLAGPAALFAVLIANITAYIFTSLTGDPMDFHPVSVWLIISLFYFALPIFGVSSLAILLTPQKRLGTFSLYLKIIIVICVAILIFEILTDWNWNHENQERLLTGLPSYLYFTYNLVVFLPVYYAILRYTSRAEERRSKKYNMRRS